jgi:hypothetical protein
MTPAMLTGAVIIAVGGLVLVGRGLPERRRTDQMAVGLDDQTDCLPCAAAAAS